MRQGGQTRRVTIEYVTDDASLKRALDAVDQLNQQLTGLGGGQGSKRGKFMGPPPPTPTSAPPTYQGPHSAAPMSPFVTPVSAGQTSYMQSAQSMTITGVNTVTITATTVNVSGPITGGGGGAPMGPSPQATTGGVQHAQAQAQAHAQMINMSRYHTPAYNMRGFVGDELASVNWYKASLFQQLIPNSMFGAANAFMERFMNPVGQAINVPVPSRFAAAGGSAATPFQIGGTPPPPGSKAALGQAFGAVGRLAPWVAAAMALHSGSEAYTAYHQTLLETEMTGARFGGAAVSGQWVSAAERARRDIMWREEPSRRAWRSGLQSSGLWQVGNFITGGLLDRREADIDQSQALRAEMAGVKEQLEFQAAMGVKSAQRALRGFKSYDELSRYSDGGTRTTAETNELATRQLEKFDTLETRLKGLFSSSGLLGLANSPLAQKFISATAANRFQEQQIAAGIMGAGRVNSYLGLEQMFGSGGTVTDWTSANMLTLMRGQADQSQIAQLRAAAVAKGYTTEDANRGLYVFSKQSLDRQYGAAQAGAQAMTSLARGQYYSSRGASVAQTSRYTLAGASQVYNKIAYLEEEYSAMKSMAINNPQMQAELAQKRAEIEQARAEAAALEKQGYIGPYQEKLDLAQLAFSRAGMETTRLGFTGVDPRYNKGYQGQIDSARRTMDTIAAMRGDIDAWSRLTPIERAQLETQFDSARLQAEYLVPRQRVEDIRGTSLSYTGVAEAGRQTAVTQAGLYGSPEALAQARRQQLQTINETISVEREYLESLKNNLSTVKERNDVEARIIDLERQRAAQEEQIKRDEVAGRMAITQAHYATYSSTAGREALLGGSLASVGSRAGGVAEQRKLRDQIKAELERQLAKSGGVETTETARLRAQLANTELGISQDVVGMSSYAPGPGLRLKMAENDVAYQIMTRTHVAYGNVRGALGERMGLVDEQILGVRAQAKAALAQAKTPGERQAILASRAEQERALWGEKVGIQQQLESGFTERLISEVYNAPRSFSGVMSAFTRREASQFLTVQPFGGNKEKMDYFKSKGRLWYKGYSHAMGTPDGFNEMAITGLSQAGAKEAGYGFGGQLGSGGVGSVDVGGQVTIEVVVRVEGGADGSSGLTGQSTVKQVNLSNQTLNATLKPSKGAQW